MSKCRNVDENFTKTKILFQKRTFLDHRVQNVPFTTFLQKPHCVGWFKTSQGLWSAVKKTRLNSSKHNFMAKSSRLSTKRNLSNFLKFFFPFFSFIGVFSILKCKTFAFNNIHEKITQFWLAEKGVQFFCNTGANLLHECKIQMVSDWPKTQKKPPKTNQTLAVLTTKFKKTAMVSCKERFDFVRKTTIEKLKKHSINLNTVKSTSFWINVLKTRC